MNLNLEIVGLEEFVEGLIDEEKIQKALGEACALVERAAKEKAPKDTGALRRSIESKVEGLEGVVFTPLEYAPYVEFGTGLFAENGGRTDKLPWCYQDDEGNWHSTYGQHPQPFMRPALDENREQILRIVAEGITND